MARARADATVGRIGPLRPWVAAAIASALALAAAAQQLTAAHQYFQQGYAYHMGDGVGRDLEAALRFYREALRHDPELYEGHANAGHAYYELKRYRHARQHLSRALAIVRQRDDLSEAEEASLSNALGSCYFQEESMAEAERWFRFAIDRNPGLSEAHYNLINLLIANGRTEEARAAIAVASRQAPGPRYGLFEGRLRSRESHAEWSPNWLIPTVLIFAGSLVVYALYRRARRPASRRRV